MGSEPFAVGEVVETVKGAKFWGEIVSAYEVDEAILSNREPVGSTKTWRCDVRATAPDFLGTIHVYPAAQLRRRAPASPPLLQEGGVVAAARRILSQTQVPASLMGGESAIFDLKDVHACAEAIVRLALPAGDTAGAEPVAWRALRMAYEAAKYQPGDHPVVPAKIAIFMDTVKHLLAAPTRPSVPAEVTERVSTKTQMEQHKAFFTYDAEAARDMGFHFYYFAPLTRTPGNLTQRRVEAIIDIAPDGTLAGVELIDNMPPLTAALASVQGVEL